MRNLRIAFCLLAACWLLAGCKSAAAPSAGAPDVVTSDDGLAQLTIPASALPNGIKLSDVHISKVAPSSQAASSGADVPLGFYRLEPDGMTWQQPITFTLIITGQVHSLPLLWLVSKDKAEVLASVQAAIDVAGNNTFISVPVSHFSTIAVAYGFFDVTISDPGAKIVRDVFPVTVDVSRSAWFGHVMTAGKAGPPLAAYVRITSEDFAVKQGIFFATQPIVSPDQILDAPARQSSSAGTVTVTRQFQCVKAGTGSISHNAYIEFQQEFDTFVLPGGVGANYVPPANSLTSVPEKTKTTKLNYTITTRVKCVIIVPTKEPPTITPSPTATPTGTPSPTATPTGTPSPTPSPIPAPLPVVKKFVALFVPEEKSTHYTVTASDPNGGVLTYAWSRTNKCGLFGPTNAATVVWNHPDQEGGCPNEPVHPGTIIVIVSNAGGSVTCEYHDGSASGNVAMCVNSK